MVQVLVVFGIILLGRKIADKGIVGPKPKFDMVGAILSGLGLLSIVIGILSTNTYGWLTSREDFSIGDTVIIPQGGISPIWIFVAIGSLLLIWFFRHIRNREKEGKEPLLSTKLFHNRVSNLGLVTQNIQWLTMQGTFFVVSVFLQTVRGYNAIQTGVLLTPAIVGVLVLSTITGRLAKRFSQKRLIVAGFVTTLIGTAALIFFSGDAASGWGYILSLFLIGAGIGVMLTSSVNVVQGSFPDKDQGEISGLSRSVSNLGSSMGTAIAGSVLVGAVAKGNAAFAWALLVLLGFGLIGLIAAFLLPRGPTTQPAKN